MDADEPRGIPLDQAVDEFKREYGFSDEAWQIFRENQDASEEQIYRLTQRLEASEQEAARLRADLEASEERHAAQVRRLEDAIERARDFPCPNCGHHLTVACTDCDGERATSARLREAGDNLAAVAGPTVDFVGSFEESENAQNLALLLALQIVAWQQAREALAPAAPRGSEAEGEGE